MDDQRTVPQQFGPGVPAPDLEAKDNHAAQLCKDRWREGEPFDYRAMSIEQGVCPDCGGRLLGFDCPACAAEPAPITVLDEGADG
jgi:hypothetical protein